MNNIMKQILNEWKKFLNESGFPNRIKNIDGKVKWPFEHCWVYDRRKPRWLKRCHPKKNRALNKELMAWMRERGQYGPIRIRGRFGNKERSMIIPNITREDMVEAGKYPKQETVIWGEKTVEDGSLCLSTLKETNFTKDVTWFFLMTMFRL